MMSIWCLEASVLQLQFHFLYIYFTCLVKEFVLLLSIGRGWCFNSVLCYFANKWSFCVTKLYFLCSVLVVLWWTHGMQLVDDEMVKWETKSPFIESNVLYIAWLWRWSCGLFLTLRGWLKPQERCVCACTRVHTHAPEKQTERLSLKNRQFRAWL